MVLTALRGALGFLTRVPVGRSERAWRAFGDAPAAVVPVGYLVGAAGALPFLLAWALGPPAATVALGYLLVLFAVTGVTHADGLADLGDAAVVHGGPDRRREVMGDSRLGVGGTVALGLDLVGLALAAVALAPAPVALAVGVVVAAEVAAKLAMVAVAVLGESAHPGLGEHLTGGGPAHLVLGGLLALPVGLATWPGVAAPVALLAALAVAPCLLAWATRRVGGVTGDVLGATNELARLAALHAGVVAWTLS